MNFLSINGKLISYQDLKLGNFRADNLYESNTLQFCSDWLKGTRNSFDIRSSGSTGDAKVIILTRSKMNLSAKMTCQTLKLTPEVNVLVCINTGYIGGLMMLVRCFENSMNPIIVEPDSDLISQMIKVDFAFAAFVPLQIEKMLKQPGGSEALSSIDTIIIGGAPISPTLSYKLRDFKNNIYQTFGMTETLSHIALRKINDENDRYTGLDGVTFSTNESGCLVIHSAINDNVPLVTNDLVELLSEKEFKWIGRKDNIINSGGIKVSSEKVEEIVAKAFNGFGIQANFFVYGTAAETFGEVVSLAIEGIPFPEDTEKQILKEIRDLSEKYGYVRLVRYIPKFCFTATGKIDRIKSKSLLEGASQD